MINPVFLRTYLSLCEQKSFSKTARALHMTQPGVSQHLQWLEEHFAVPLVVRDRRSFELTEAGNRVREYARLLFQEHENLKTTLRTDDPAVGLLRLASPGSFGMKMYSFLLELVGKRPELELRYEFAPNHSVVAAVRSEAIDMGFVSQLPNDYSGLEVEEIDRENLCLVVPANFSSRKYQSLVQLGFIEHPDGPHYATRLLSHMFPKEFKGLGEIPVRGWVNTLMRIPDSVVRGLGFTALPEFACRSYPDQTNIHYFTPRGMPPDKIYAISRKNVPLPKRYGEVLRLFRRIGTQKS